MPTQEEIQAAFDAEQASSNAVNPHTQEEIQAAFDADNTPTQVSSNAVKNTNQQQNVPDQEFEMDDLDSKNDWLQQARTIYNYENKDKKFKGSNKELSDWFKDRHSSLANNLTNLGRTAYDTSNMSDDVKKAWAQSLDTYDRTNSDFGTFLRAVGNTFADPLTYVGAVGTAGLGVVAKVAGKGAAKKGLKELLGRFDFKKQLSDEIASQTTKGTAEEFAKTGTAKGVTKEVLKKARKEAAKNVGKSQTVTGAVAGAGWGGGYAGAREGLEVGIDKKDEVDLLNVGLGTLVGVAAGGVAGRYIPQLTEKLGRGRAVKKLDNEVTLDDPLYSLPEGRSNGQAILARIKRELWDDSGLGPGFKKAQTRKQNIKRTIENDVQNTFKSLTKAIHKEYKIKSFKDLDDSELQIMDSALKGDSVALNSLTSRGYTNVVKQIGQMRTNIKNYQKDLLDSGVIDKATEAGQDLEVTIKKSMDGSADGELYITRQFAKFDDPDWKKNLQKREGGSKIIDDAVDLVIRNKEKAYAEWAIKTNKENKENFKKAIEEWESKGSDPRIIPIQEKELGLIPNSKTKKKHQQESIAEVDVMLTSSDAAATFSALNKAGFGNKAALILTRKKDIPEQIRLLLGEYNDPFTNYSNTVSKLFSTIETFKYEKDIAELINHNEIKGAKSYRDSPSGDFNTSLRSDLPNRVGDQTPIEKQLKELQEKALRENMPEDVLAEERRKLIEVEAGIIKPLNDFMAYPEVAEAIKMNNELKPVQLKILRDYLTAQAYTRAAKTVYSPSAVSRNFLGSGMMSMAAGYLNPKKLTSMKKGYESLRNDIFEKGNEEAIEIMNLKGAALGYRQSGVDFNALKGALEDAGNDNFFTFDSPLYKGNKEIIKRARKFNTSAVKIYQAMDDIWKEVAFNTEKDMQRQILLDNGFKPDEVVRVLRTSKGIEVPITRLDEEAAKLVGEHMQNYANVPVAIKKVRRLPIADFLAFKTEMARTSKNILRNSIRDIKAGQLLMKNGEEAIDINGNPTGQLKGHYQRNMGLKRLGSAVAVIGSIPAITTASGYMMGMDDPVEGTGYTKTEGMERILSSEYNLGSNYLNLGTDQNGKGRRINLSYLNPWASGSDMFTAAVRALKEGNDIDDAMSTAAIDGIFKPLLEIGLTESMLFKAINNIRNNENEYGQPLTQDKDSFLDTALAYGLEMWRAFEPGGVKTGKDIYISSSGDFDKKELKEVPGYDSEPSSPLKRFGVRKGKTGSKLYLQDQLTSLFGIKPEAYDIKTKFALKLKNIERKRADTGKIFKDAYQNRGVTTSEELVDAYRKSLERNYSYAKDINNLVQQYKAAASKVVTKNGKKTTRIPDEGDIFTLINKEGLFPKRLDKNFIARTISGSFFITPPNINDIRLWQIDTKNETGRKPINTNDLMPKLLEIHKKYMLKPLNTVSESTQEEIQANPHTQEEIQAAFDKGNK